MAGAGREGVEESDAVVGCGSANPEERDDEPRLQPDKAITSPVVSATRYITATPGTQRADTFIIAGNPLTRC
jgi:hypothetical protein